MISLNTPTYTLWSLLCLMLSVANTVAQQTPFGNGSGSLDKQVNNILTQATDIQVAPGIVAVLSIAIGFMVTFYGYKLIKPVLFVCGFVVGSFFAYVIVYRIFREKDFVLTAAWIAFVIGGLLVGGLVICMYKLGIFAVGATAGVLLGFTLNNTFGYRIWPSNPTAMLYIFVITLGLLFGCLALWIERPVLIVATSVFGAISCVWGIGYYAGRYPNGADLEFWRQQLANGNWQYNVPNEWWGYLAGTIVLFLLGIYVQFQHTSNGVYHQHRSVQGSQAQAQAHEGKYNNAATPPAARGNPIAHV